MTNLAIQTTSNVLNYYESLVKPQAYLKLDRLFSRANHNHLRLILADYEFIGRRLQLFIEDSKFLVDNLDECAIITLDEDFIESCIAENFNVVGDAFEWLSEQARPFERADLIDYIFNKFISDYFTSKSN
jgi:hypothetical protein